MHAGRAREDLRRVARGDDEVRLELRSADPDDQDDVEGWSRSIKGGEADCAARPMIFWSLHRRERARVARVLQVLGYGTSIT